MAHQRRQNEDHDAEHEEKVIGRSGADGELLAQIGSSVAIRQPGKLRGKVQQDLIEAKRHHGEEHAGQARADDRGDDTEPGSQQAADQETNRRVEPVFCNAYGVGIGAQTEEGAVTEAEQPGKTTSDIPGLREINEEHDLKDQAHRIGDGGRGKEGQDRDTTKPMESTRPNSDSVFSEKPNRYMRANVPTNDIGTATSGMIDARQV